MQYAVPKLRPPLKTFGGKAYLARRIVDRFDDHHVYCEPFAGGLNVLLNRPPALREVAADLNGMLIHFWRTLQDRGDASRPASASWPTPRTPSCGRGPPWAARTPSSGPSTSSSATG